MLALGEKNRNILNKKISLCVPNWTYPENVEFGLYLFFKDIRFQLINSLFFFDETKLTMIAGG
jgi:hypothetical protein